MDGKGKRRAGLASPPLISTKEQSKLNRAGGKWIIVLLLAGIILSLGLVFAPSRNNNASRPATRPVSELNLGCVVYEDVIEKQLTNGGKINLDLSSHCYSPWIEVDGKSFTSYGCLDAQFLYADGKVSDWMERCSGRRHSTQKKIKLVRFRPGADQPSDAWPVEVIVHPRDR